MTLDTGPLTKGTPDTIALTDFNALSTELDNAFPLKPINILSLSQRLMQGFMSDYSFFFDDFLGYSLLQAWFLSFSAGGDGGIWGYSDAYVLTGGGATDYCILQWGNHDRALSEGKPVLFETKVRALTEDTLTYITHLVGLYRGPDDYVAFRLNDGVGAVPNWYAVCRVGGVETAVDTGVAVSGAYQKLEIDYENTNSVKFYIDDVLKATIVTNILTLSTTPYFEVKTNNNKWKEFLIDYLTLIGTRP